MATSSLLPRKYAQLLFRLVKNYQPQHIVELGTSFGITTAYLAAGNPGAKLITCEGVPSIATIAGKGFGELGLTNIELVEGDFAATLSPVLARLKNVDLAFIDGNHRKVSTLSYFHQLLQYSTSSTILVFDDIHWSKEMEEAWALIRQEPSVTLTIDLFFTGIVFFDGGIKIPQHFVLRF